MDSLLAVSERETTADLCFYKVKNDVKETTNFHISVMFCYVDTCKDFFMS